MTGAEFFFWAYFGLIFSFFPLSLCLLVMHVLMPQAVLDRYWKGPHFRPFELMLFSGWSFFAPMRTIMFMWVFMVPRLGKKRDIIDPHRLVPRWYRIVSIVLCVWVIVIATGFLGMTLGLVIYAYATDNPNTPDWTAITALLVGIAGFAFVAIRQWRINRRDEKLKREGPGRRKKDEPA